MALKQATTGFVTRLKAAMTAQGHSNARARSGIEVDKLCAWTKSSRQNIRRYLRGEAIPNATAIRQIASQLDICPGWLLFGSPQVSPMWHNRQTLPLTQPALDALLKHALPKLCQTDTKASTQQAAQLIALAETMAVSEGQPMPPNASQLMVLATESEDSATPAIASAKRFNR